jgi:hypothetical protein
VKGKQAARATEMNFEKFFENKGGLKYNVLLMAGDVVYVPEKEYTIPDFWGTGFGVRLVQGASNIFTGH